MPSETPQMHSFSYTPTNSIPNQEIGRFPSHMISDNMLSRQLVGHQQNQNEHWATDTLDTAKRHFEEARRLTYASGKVTQSTTKVPIKEVKMNTRRIVQIYVADPDDQVPLDKALLYKGDPFLTDLTDQELWYGIGLPDLLKTHNDYRITVVNKKVKERTENLETIRIKDLSMLVVTLAQF